MQYKIQICCIFNKKGKSLCPKNAVTLLNIDIKIEKIREIMTEKMLKFVKVNQ